jgi:membrane protein DedA with SNARE-associated domain
MVAPFLFGATRFDARRFAVLNVLGAAVWALSISLLGYSFGAGIERVLTRAGRVEELLLGALALAVVGFLVTRHYWHRSERATQRRV